LACHVALPWPRRFFVRGCGGEEDLGRRECVTSRKWGRCSQDAWPRPCRPAPPSSASWKHFRSLPRSTTGNGSPKNARASSVAPCLYDFSHGSDRGFRASRIPVQYSPGRDKCSRKGGMWTSRVGRDQGGRGHDGILIRSVWRPTSRNLGLLGRRREPTLKLIPYEKVREAAAWCGLGTSPPRHRLRRRRADCDVQVQDNPP